MLAVHACLLPDSSSEVSQWPHPLAWVRDRTYAEGRGPLGWGIMRYMGIVEIGVIVVFIVAVALAVWWTVVRLRG